MKRLACLICAAAVFPFAATAQELTHGGCPSAIGRDDNGEIARLYDADQAARVKMDPREFMAFIAADKVRRDQVVKLMGALRTAADYCRAAMVFQHGGETDDQLRAHILAMAAVAKGDKGAAWLAAASLDRYLQDVGRPQVFGTQYAADGDASFTQEPYDKALLSDVLRAEFAVPGQAEQDVRRERLERERAAAARR